jgi:dihydroorotate dehydrogenase
MIKYTIPAVPLGYLAVQEYLRYPHRPAPRPVDEVLGTPTASTVTRLYRSLVRPVMFQLDPEDAHQLVLWTGRLFGEFTRISATVSDRVHWVFGTRPRVSSNPRLHQTLMGLEYEYPVGIPAGFDKNGHLVKFFSTSNPLQIGHVDIGSVSAVPWAGNPRPRVFRLVEDEAVINRMGLGNEGMTAVAPRLAREGLGGVQLSVNITKTPDSSIEGESALEDFIQSFYQIPGTVRTVTLNVSCPNTAEGKTFESVDALTVLLKRIAAENRTGGHRILIKISPPPPEWTEEYQAGIDSILSTARENGVSGFVVSNTVTDRSIPLRSPSQTERGGLSGRPVFGRQLQLIEMISAAGFLVIGVGGVSSGDTAIDMLSRGANLVGVYTGLIYHGPGLPRDINNAIERRIVMTGVNSIADITGSN